MGNVDTSKWVAQIKIDKAVAKIEYDHLIEQDKEKTFMDILPADFKKFARSVIKRRFLHLLDKAEKILSESGCYGEKVIDKKVLVRYIMLRNNDYFLAVLFVPKLDETRLIIEEYAKLKETGNLKKSFELACDEIEKEQANTIEKYREIDHILSSLDEYWNMYQSREKIKSGELDNGHDMESDGYPSMSRGAMCYLLTPVKGDYPKELETEFKLFNPRTKKDVTYKILGKKTEYKTPIYKCENQNGKVVFLFPLEEVEEAYDCLFTTNKEIFSGWWNRTLISKEYL